MTKRASVFFPALSLSLVVLAACATSEKGPVWTTAAEAPALKAAFAGAKDPAAPSLLVDSIRAGRSKTYPIDRKAYEAVDPNLPIGVFDSGIGGLTVLSAILELDEFDNTTHKPGRDGVPDFADERFVYFGDQANMPYGRYASAGHEDFLRELIVEDAAFLLGSRYFTSPRAPTPSMDKPPVKAVVIACNTATAYGIEDVRAAFDAWKIPMILVGVVEAGAEGAVAAIKERKDESAVAVMATVGTCKSQAYPKTIDRFAQAAGARAPTVVQQGSVGLAGAIEGDPAFVRPRGKAPSASDGAGYQGPAVGNTAAAIDPALAREYAFEPGGLLGDPAAPASWRLDSVENYVHYDVATLVEAHRKAGTSVPIGTVVLGCTHFPFQRDRIAASLERLRTFRDASGAEPYRNVVSEHVELVDPAKLTAKQLYASLVAKSRLRDSRRPPVLADNAFFLSKPNPALAEVKLTADGTLDADYKYGRKAGNFEVETVKRVPLRTADLTPELQKLLSASMPAVWASVQTFQSSRWISH
jgi:glutamate racemase